MLCVQTVIVVVCIGCAIELEMKQVRFVHLGIVLFKSYQVRCSRQKATMPRADLDTPDACYYIAGLAFKRAEM